jgi:hypothetical protein
MKPKPSASVTVAAIVGICLAALTILGGVVAIVGMIALPAASGPPFVKPLSVAMIAIGCGLAGFGIVTCVAVLRLRGWARISILVWAGVMTFFSGLSILFIAFVPFPAAPANSPADPSVVRAVVMFFYGVPLLVGTWWLVLFNQNSVKEEFLPPGSGHSEGALEIPRAPHCPLPLAILAWVCIVSMGISLLIYPLLHLPVTMILFGHIFHGKIGATLFFATLILNLAGAIGLLKLQRWSYPLMLGLYFFWMVSGTVSVLSPRFEQNMRDMLAQMSGQEGPLGQTTFVYTRTFGILSLLPAILIIWLFLYYHTRFMEACAAKQGAHRPQ